MCSSTWLEGVMAAAEYDGEDATIVEELDPFAP
ncbi:hypothetical protein SAMN05892877_12524 [Rhizobium subbaraonis]|uniref:Uncharacterized protein n=1 Tax=Rhizobium subbaraonis TaxID=908946 RepID=A0A285UYE9_9HYPH|nr:hypothetical protein BN949_03690 [Agrobacterium tumefaciens]SOC46914.1 hypothetical protein SAMN05892877_12524 [Rhizobium subbaraonis]